MKRKTRRALFAAVLCGAFTVIGMVFSGPVSANSGPVYWQGYPSTDILLVQEDSPITVKNENLVFDFSAGDNSDFTVSGEVTATYEIFNPTNEAQSVQMAFPFVGRLDGLLPDDVVVTVDNRAVPYAVYIGDVVNSYGNPFQKDKEVSFAFAGIVNTITDEPYQAESFAEKEKGKLYRLDVEPTTGQRINFAVEFDFNQEKTKVFTKGFNRYERDGDKTRIAAWCYEPETLEIFVLGEDLDLKMDAYTDGELREKTDLYACRISAQEPEVKSYLTEYIKKNTGVKNDGVTVDPQLYNLYARALDEYFRRNGGFSFEHDLLAQENYRRILTLLYTAEFPAKGEKEVVVRYKTSGTMDKTKTPQPLYTFDYILNPAAHWRDFTNLNIQIITPEQAPYIVKSSIALAKDEQGVYTATLAGLPEDDLSFALYGEEQITLLDRAAGSLRSAFRYFAPFIIGGIALLMAGGIMAAAVLPRSIGTGKRSRKRK